jgi:steroid delta-isomerase-like uncharacterized protein
MLKRQKQIQLLAGLLIAASLVITGCASTQETTLARNKDLIRRLHQEVWSNGNVKELNEFYSKKIVWHLLPLGVELKGLDQLEGQVRGHRQAFPDWTEKVQQMVAEGDLVVTRFISTGTNKGSFAGNPPTGKQIQINEVAIHRIVDGKIVEQWVIPDLFSLNQQLGLNSRSN